MQSSLTPAILTAMPSVYDLKPRFQTLLRPVMERLVRLGFSPNAITLVAVVGSFVVGFLLGTHTRWILLLLPGWLFARMALNAIDGMMAREKNMATPFGAVLNELGDVLSDLGLYLPLAFFQTDAIWPVVAFVVGSILTEFCGVLGRALGAARHYEGPMGKSDRAFWVGALAVATAIWPRLMDWWVWFFWLCAALAVVTCWNRIAGALRELRR